MAKRKVCFESPFGMFSVHKVEAWVGGGGGVLENSLLSFSDSENLGLMNLEVFPTTIIHSGQFRSAF